MNFFQQLYRMPESCVVVRLAQLWDNGDFFRKPFTVVQRRV